ncbi:MAG: hypothetical protein KGV51_00940 [Moraxellaceae bacterium]|nr:hypothetical protein [Moraxellaceae bacterium]
MTACKSCLKNICCCNTDETKTELTQPNCQFVGIHKNVDVEVNSDCQVISITHNDTEQHNLCDPCTPPPIEEDNGCEELIEQIKESTCDECYEKGKADGIKIGEELGYSKGFAEGQVKACSEFVTEKLQEIENGYEPLEFEDGKDFDLFSITGALAILGLGATNLKHMLGGTKEFIKATEASPAPKKDKPKPTEEDPIGKVDDPTELTDNTKGEEPIQPDDPDKWDTDKEY